MYQYGEPGRRKSLSMAGFLSLCADVLFCEKSFAAILEADAFFQRALANHAACHAESRGHFVFGVQAGKETTFRGAPGDQANNVRRVGALAHATRSFFRKVLKPPSGNPAAAGG